MVFVARPSLAGMTTRKFKPGLEKNLHAALGLRCRNVEVISGLQYGSWIKGQDKVIGFG